MKKLLVLVIGSILLTGCSSDNSSIVNCIIEDWYMKSEVEIEYNSKDETELIAISMSIDYSMFGEEYFEEGYESALEMADSYNIYDGIIYEASADDLVVTMVFNIDLTKASEEDINNIGISLDSFALASNDFILEQEAEGAVCTRK